MNQDWDTSIAFVLKQEGGYTLDPNDPGGETNFGISKRAYPNLDIKNLTLDQAKNIYERDYWTVCECDQLAWPFSIIVFDAAVNQGVKTAIRMMQISLNLLADGLVGDLTISSTHKAGQTEIKKFLVERIKSYTNDNGFKIYAENWLYRIMSLAQVIFK